MVISDSLLLNASLHLFIIILGEGLLKNRKRTLKGTLWIIVPNSLPCRKCQHRLTFIFKLRMRALTAEAKSIWEQKEHIFYQKLQKKGKRAVKSPTNLVFS